MTEERAPYTTPDAVADRLHRQEQYIARKNGALHALDVEVQRQNETIARLEADNKRLRHLDSMPVDALRYVVLDCDIRYAEGADVVLAQWLATLDGDA